MGEPYFILKRKLEDLGYNNTLPLDAVPLVECLLADLLQTTRSLQHYMDLSKEALLQRDSLMLEAEPYKCDNVKLIQENNHLHRELMQLKEESIRFSKEYKRKMKTLSEELIKKDSTIVKLQHDVRDLSLRGLCAGTHSSRLKSKRKEAGDDNIPKVCGCDEKKASERDLEDLTKHIKSVEAQNEKLVDENNLLKIQVEHRDDEIVRLNMLLEGGKPRPIVTAKRHCDSNTDGKVQDMITQIQELESTNIILKKEIDKSLAKQHEAMTRALNLADKNKSLQEELKKVDALALDVEADCNKRLATLMNEVNDLQTRLERVTRTNIDLEKELSQTKVDNTSKVLKLQESLHLALKDKDALQRDMNEMAGLNRKLQDRRYDNSDCDHDFKKCITKEDLKSFLENERKKYEKHIIDIQEKLNVSVNLFEKHMMKCKEKDSSISIFNSSSGNSYARDLNNKICESEQKLLMLKKENEELKYKIYSQQDGDRLNYKDVISQLNAENTELSKENISLSQQLSHYKTLNTASYSDKDIYRKDIPKYKEEIEKLNHEIHVLRKDKHEYNLRYKESMDLVDKLKRDLAFKQREMEQMAEENCSYKMTNRNDKASTEHLREECNFLREQLKRIQSDVVKEKTHASQIRNIQLETERSSNEIQNELLTLQKKLSLSKDTTESLEKRCQELQSEILSLKNDKSKLIDSIKKVDQERDKLVIELDNKTENVSVLEQKVKSQSYEISKYESDLNEMKRKLSVHKVSEHKLMDTEAQIKYLNGEILRLNQQYDNAVMENKRLQNNLADASGTLKLAKIEYDKSRKEVDGLKAQLQHYVAEIRRIEEMLSHKEAERTDMLEQFASLSVEANILETTNHSLESESASKSLKLQTYVAQIQSLESQLSDKESIIETQAAEIATLTCRITTLESEVKLLVEEKIVLEQNISYLKQMCNTMQTEQVNMTRGLGETDSELKLYENKIKTLSSTKHKLETEKDEMKMSLSTTEKLLSNARKEIVELKLALQDATSETKSLQDRISRMSRIESEVHKATLTREELEIPLMLEETIHEVSNEEEDSARFHDLHKRYGKYTHGSTL